METGVDFAHLQVGVPPLLNDLTKREWLMSILRSRRSLALLLAGSMALTASLAGCEPGNPNEAEYFKHTPPGKPPENPDESNSARRARTQRVAKQITAIEARTKPAPPKGGETKKAP
jgi:hypothetical protein